MRTASYLASVLAFLGTACSRADTADANTHRHRAGLTSITADARCEMVEREDGSCVLWGPSLIELIARPELYDGKPVRVIGFVNFEFEGNGLYVSREDWRQSIFRNGIWIDPPSGFESDSAPSHRQPNQRYVVVEATFRAGRGGHFGMWSGALERVTRLDSWGVDSTAERPVSLRR